MTGRKKGLSNDEKKTRLLELFHESRDVWILKDLERVAAKEKGIVQNTVKDILDQLISDNLVTMEKIGISNYFWSFPGAAAAQRRNALQDLEEQVASAKKQRMELDSQIEKAQIGREDTEERAELLAAYKASTELQASLKAELVQFKDCDPALIDAKAKAAENAKIAANRWTDNIFCLKSYCRDKFNIDSADFSRHFSIPGDIDNLD
ncbi:hypothetical protein CcCBS67573_g08000 [Chytriomyces confervae]|uniref:Meiotic nuclear division protein 1 n=1 Tax=Chytriomyces confervae TaxID=246404 RepID=A0A507ERG3_9FUNG|nr:hypothetical protein CcCBS67573_g08000 [Chytriomyces confervae]